MDENIISLIETASEHVFLFGVMFIFTLAVVIMLHEFGHYLAAKLCNVHVEQFAFGFGKEIVGFGGNGNNGGSTRWSICALPLGGYVKLFGDVDKNNPVVWDHENERARTLSDDELKVAFCTKSVWQRIFIVAAGPAINLLLTLAIFVLVFTLHGQRSTPLTVTAVAIGAPAEQAGIQVGDKIVAMDGAPVRRLDDVYDYTWNENPPVEHTYTVERDGKTLHIPFTARRLEYIDSKGIKKEHGQSGMVRFVGLQIDDILSVKGQDTVDAPEKARQLLRETLGQKNQISISFSDDKKKEPFRVIFPERYNKHLENPDSPKYNIIYAADPEEKLFIQLGVFEAVSRSFKIMSDLVVGTYNLLSVAYKGKTDEPVVGGIAKISEKTAEAAQAGFYDYMMFLAAFSFMIAFINLLPIPVLDGGYLVFLGYEAVTGQAIPPRIQDIALIIGLVFLGGIMIFANVSDLISLLT